MGVRSLGWRRRTEETVIYASGDPSAGSARIVLKPKLRAPLPRPEQLVRRRLLERLHDALDCKVSVISASTGYGKTTLLAQWRRAEEAEVPFAWISLDEQDNDPIRLWRHIVEALRRAVPEQEDFGADVLVGMSAAGQRFAGVTLSMLINEIAELPHRVVLMLDDYQFVTEEDAHESVAFFVEHLPENVHLVISSRSDPPLPLGRLRAIGELNEIRTEQLAFTEEEAARLLNEKMGLDIHPDDVAVLHKRTEGWPAGIYLASLSLQNKEDKHVFIEAFRGSNRYIVGLLGEEVLAGLTEEVRQFLLETSVLRSMTGPLCDAVTGREGSVRLLRELASSNLFVVSLDEQGEWYRYHHLFSELLLYELKSSRPDLVPTLRRRASVWLEDSGFFEEAIRQAIAAADYERVGLLLARHWYGYVVAGQTATVQRWLESLPEEMMVTVPLPLLIQRNHEQVGASELLQEPGGTLPARHRVAKRTRHRPKHRGLEQKLPRLPGKAGQNFLSQEADDVAVGAPERLDEGVFVLLVLQREGGEVEPRGPSFGTLEQHREVVGADAKLHPLVEQALGFLRGEGELFGADLVHLSPGPQSPQRKRRVGAAGDDEVGVLGEVLHEEGYRLVRVLLGYELVVIEH